MPFGDSNGAFYEDEFHRGVEEWNSFTGDSGMVVSPNQVHQNQQLESQDYKVMGGIEVNNSTSTSGKNGPYDTPLPSDDKGFQDWKAKHAPNDSGVDYDLQGAYLGGATPAENGHFPDTWKKPNHPTFSDQSKYAKDSPESAGSWEGDKFIPPSMIHPIADRTTSSPLVTITDGDIDKAMGIATAFSGGGLATKWPKGYYDKVPLEQRLSRSSTEPSHPGYRWDVLDKDTGKVVRKDVMTATGARRSVDNMDNKYGGYKHRAEPRQIDEGSYTQGELDFIKSNKIDFNAE